MKTPALKVPMSFDDAMRCAVKVKPQKKTAAPKKKRGGK